MTLPIVDSLLPRPTRRQFLATAAAGLALWQCDEWACGQITGPVMPKLAAYDELMTTFMREHKPPGAALAVTYHGRLVYARGFGYADLEKHEPVRPASLFRIASVSKPFTATAVMHLVEQGKLKLDDRVFPILKLQPHLERGARFDPRWHDITVRHCLQHTGGWNRDKSFDPMAAETAEQVAKALSVPLPIIPRQIIRYTMGKPLDFDPGTAYAYSNFGYCVLGRVIEAVSGKPYHEFVRQTILAPLGIHGMQLGKNLLKDRAPGEVKYYDSGNRTGRAISGPKIGAAGAAALRRGVHRDHGCQRRLDRLGGRPGPLRRRAGRPETMPILSEESIRTMLAPPPGPVGHGPKGRPKPDYYACGWDVRPAGQAGQIHQMARRFACRQFHAAGLPRRRHRLGGPVQPRCRQGRQGVRRSDRSAPAQAGQ